MPSTEQQKELKALKEDPQGTLDYMIKMVEWTVNDFKDFVKGGINGPRMGHITTPDGKMVEVNLSVKERKQLLEEAKLGYKRCVNTLNDIKAIELIPNMGIHGYKGKDDFCKHSLDGSIIQRPIK